MDGLPASYTRTDREVDQQHCCTPTPPAPQPGVPQQPRQIGPAERRLQTFGRLRGWVFGAWGEASEEVRGLVQRLANSRLEVADMQPGNRGKARTKLRASRIDWLHQKAAVFHCSPAAGQAPPRHTRLHLVSCSVCVVVIQSTVHSPANHVNKPSFLTPW